MASMLASSVVRSWIGAPVGSGQILFCICCFSAKHTPLRRKSIMCPIGGTCLSTDCCFSELVLVATRTMPFFMDNFFFLVP
jgi:hypothetical protein